MVVRFSATFTCLRMPRFFFRNKGMERHRKEEAGMTVLLNWNILEINPLYPMDGKGFSDFIDLHSVPSEPSSALSSGHSVLPSRIAAQV